MAALESVLYPIVVKINEYLSNYILIILLISVGLWYSIKTRFVQIRCFKEGMKKVFGNISLRGEKQKQGMSSFQALATAIAAQVFVVPITAYYFNSINVDKLIVTLEEVIEDKELLDFIIKLLKEDRVVFEGKVIEEKKLPLIESGSNSNGKRDRVKSISLFFLPKNPYI